MREVMISIKPRWVELIASGKKTVEVRKTKPKLETPFKVYIYCTQGDSLNYLKSFAHSKLNKYWIDNKAYGCNVARANGKVIGEFVCDRIIDISYMDLFENFRRLTHDIITPSCLKVKEIEDYIGRKDGYGWHITDLVIYDKPRELGEFETYHCSYVMSENGFPIPSHHIKTPPQSWFYVKSKEPRQTAD